jgi:uncharacterized protein YbjT (DUF2867 family)
MAAKPVLVAGATGYVGGRLVPRLLDSGRTVRALVRSSAKLLARPWAGHPGLEIVQADLLDGPAVARAALGCGSAYYLVHSMEPGQGDFAERERRAARNMAAAAAQAGLDRIVYLGGLGDEDSSLSHHLRSRMETARILASEGVPVTHLRAGAILGAGSASFEILRYLVDRLPVMITPRWVHTPCQPIAIRNVLTYLVGCLDCDRTVGQTLDIGGPDVLTYRELMEMYAEEAGLPRRLVIPVPVLTPRLSSYWIHLVTPVHASLARPLAEGLSVPVVCKDNRIRSLIPQHLLSCREAIRMALKPIEQPQVQSSRNGAGLLVPPEWPQEGDAAYAGGTLFESAWRICVRSSAEAVWEPVARIGGDRGWYFGDRLWALRGWMDRLAGGTGLRRGRPDPLVLKVGDALDFWRVVEVDPPRKLLLLAEMKLPGQATLEFRIASAGEGLTELVQISRFQPKGLAGILYWYLLYPVHGWLFRGMLLAMAREAGGTVVGGPEPIRGRSR